MERKLRQMAQEYADGPAKEIVVQAAREMLLAESSDWQFLISTFSARDYAEVRFEDHIDRFNRLAEIADRVHSGSAITVDEKAYLTECQLKDAPFQEIDLSLWSAVASRRASTAKS
jgi:1,4-alpha-glucan branching enzyme